MRLKLWKALPAFGEWLTLESQRADPALDGIHAVTWTRYIPDNVYKTAWHLWSQNKRFFTADPTAVFAMPLDVQETGAVVDEGERVAAAAQYGKWSGMNEVRRYMHRYAHVVYDEDPDSGA